MFALANPAKKIENKCAPIFHENVNFLGKTQNLQARCGRFSHDPIFFFVLKSLKKGATEQILKNVLFQATLFYNLPYKMSKEGPFEGILGAFWIFLYGMSQGPFDTSPHLSFHTVLYQVKF
jgi:hypothetical protein